MSIFDRLKKSASDEQAEKKNTLTEPKSTLIPPMVVSDGIRFGVRFYHGNDLTWNKIWDIMKSVRGSHNSKARFWIFADEKSARAGVSAVANRVDPASAPLFLRKIDGAVRAPRPFHFSEFMRVCLWRFRDEDVEGTVASFSYDPVLGRRIKGAGGVWWGEEKVWIVPGKEPVVLIESVFVPGGVRESDIIVSDVPYKEGAARSWTKKGFLDLGTSALPDFGGLEELPEGEGKKKQPAVVFASSMEMMEIEGGILKKLQKEDLLPHQHLAVLHLLSRTSALLADDMGLGKTRSAIVAARHAASRRLIVCPASLKTNWKSEILKVYPEELLNIHIVGPGQKDVPTAATWVITNYESLAPIKAAGGGDFGVLVVDEAHYVKEVSAQRTKDLMSLARIPRRYLLTATPILNRAEEIWSLMAIGGHPLGRIPWKEFRNAFTKSKEARAQLSKRLDEWMLRRLKSETISLPGRYEVNPEISMEAAMEQSYKDILNDGTKLPIAKVVPLRKILERAKVPFIIETLESMAEESKAIVFCQYLDIVEEIMEECERLGIGAVRFTGKESSSLRKESQDAFQEDADVRVFVTTLSSGGVGLTLTKADTVIFASRPWTPALKDQAECRADRMGQVRKVCVINPLIRGTIDEDIVKMLESKGEVIESVLVQAIP